MHVRISEGADDQWSGDNTLLNEEGDVGRRQRNLGDDDGQKQGRRRSAREGE